MLREYILYRIEQIKADEFAFNDTWWKDVYVSYYVFPKGNETKHISEVIFEKLNDEDLARLFEFIIISKCEATNHRVKKTYFKKNEST